MNIKEIIGIFSIETGAPEPIILSTASKTLVGFYGNIGQNETDGLDTIVIKFTGCIKSVLGVPNDETLHGHPYYKLGLRSYGFYELEGSNLIAEIIEMNKVHNYFNREKWKGYKHYIITLHDNIFECIAKDFEILDNNDLYKKMFELLA